MLQTTPWPGGRVFYSDNGSTAVEVALKMAYQFWCHRGEPQRTRFIGFEHGYHGDTFGAMAISRDPVFFGRFEPLLFKASIVPLSPEYLEAELTKHRGEVAAVIIEPLVQGAGGMRIHTAEVLQKLAEIAQRQEVLFIADEVMTGGRTATLWAHQAARIAPDLICAGKTLAGGVLPLAATLVSPQVVEAFQTPDRRQTFFHGHSFTAHPVACAVAAAGWKGRATARWMPWLMHGFWQTALGPLREMPQVKDVRVCGTIVAVELAIEGGYLATVGRQVHEACLERGVLLRPLGNVVYAMPPLMTSRESLQQIADAITAAVKTLDFDLPR
jgi:adenosylmethionine-8-amino-7-oxononanoate aminotransferase